MIFTRLSDTLPCFGRKDAGYGEMAVARAGGTRKTANQSQRERERDVCVYIFIYVVTCSLLALPSCKSERFRKVVKGAQKVADATQLQRRSLPLSLFPSLLFFLARGCLATSGFVQLWSVTAASDDLRLL